MTNTEFEAARRDRPFSSRISSLASAGALLVLLAACADVPPAGSARSEPAASRSASASQSAGLRPRQIAIQPPASAWALSERDRASVRSVSRLHTDCMLQKALGLEDGAKPVDQIVSTARAECRGALRPLERTLRAFRMPSGDREQYANYVEHQSANALTHSILRARNRARTLNRQN